jgi:C1A family cysteine protease
MRKIKRYGWKPDLPDVRDLHYKVSKPVPLPPVVDLRNNCPPVYDQGDLGSCTANAIAAAYEFDLIKQGIKDFMPSRLFIYYNERILEGTVSEDAGAEIRDGFKTLNNIGVCTEKTLPYAPARFSKKPSTKAFTEAKKHLVTCYSRLDNTNLATLKQCLAKGFPFVFGFTVYESFESDKVAKTGIVNMPGNEQTLGGHAVICVGYNDKQKRFIVRNSWGESWGMKGYFTFPFEYMVNPNLCDDFWQMSLV